LTPWLPEDVRSSLAAVLEDGKRIAQEWVGTELLAECRKSLWLLQ
jgi:hypothetical protein